MKIDATKGLMIDARRVKAKIVGFIRDELLKARYGRLVVGLSGGVDSAVSAFLGVEAVGAANVVGVLMPYRASQPSSVSDAFAVVNSLGIKHHTVDITAAVDALAKEFGLSGDDDVSRLRLGNIMPRVRMITLYDMSVRERALVLGTSNKTELLLGYGTLWGDVACAINPLGDLYKTQVWQLAKHLRVPDGIIAKKPTADLWPGQTDEGELGLEYVEADKLLYLMLDRKFSEAKLFEAGFAPEFIARVKQIILANQFKRRGPAVAKITRGKLNKDFETVK
jgi:NAD+ synthase